MATTIDQQVALDEALVPSTQRLRIGRSNFRLPSDIQSKEATLQVVYDVLHNSPFFRAFLVMADVPEIYMQEFWATAKLHYNSIRFKMDTKKSILDLEAFREMLHISPRIPSQSFAELPTEEEILVFLSDQQVPDWQELWHRQFQTISSTNSMRILSQKNVDFAYLIWEDFVYQVEHKNQKRSNEMYYPRFTKVIIDYFMTRKPSISRQNRINWHYVRDDVLFTTIKVVSRPQTTQQYGVILPIELTTDDIRNNKAYKEYYACATGEAAPKSKASAKKKKGDSASSTTPPTPTPTTTAVSAPRLSATAKGKQLARATTPTEPTDVERTESEQLKIVIKRSRQETHISQQRGSGTDEGTGSRPRVPDVPPDDLEEELSWNSSDDEDVGEQTKGREESEGDKSDESDDGSDEGSDDDIDETAKANSDKDDDDYNEEEEIAMDDDEDTESGKGGDEVSESKGESDEEETRQKEEESFDPIPRTPEGREFIDVVIRDKHAKPYQRCRGGIHFHDGIFSNCISSNTNTSFRFDERLRSLETTFFEYRQTNPFVDAMSAIPGIVHQYMTQQMIEAVQETKGREESEGDKSDESDDGSDEGSDDDIDETAKANSDKDDDDYNEEEEIAMDDDEDTESGKGGDEVSESKGESDEEETRQKEEESFDPIPRTPEGSEDEGNDEED
nr:hypothetical protein [Tanacetum cinerariifolium]